MHSTQKSSEIANYSAQTIRDSLGSPIAYHRIFVTITGSVTAALMLSQALYWTTRTDNPEGWFYKSIKEWEEETGLTRFEQETARRKLREKGFWIEKRRGVPATVNFRIDPEKLVAALGIGPEKPHGQFAEKQQTQFAENQQTGSRKTSKLDCGQSANKFAEKPQTINEQRLHRDYAEITPERGSDALPPQTTSVQNSFSSEGKPSSNAKKVKSVGKAIKEPVPPAIAVLHEIIGYYPHKFTWGKFVERLGNDFDADRLRECGLAWLARGNKQTNYEGIVDWYFKGIPEQGGNYNGQKYTARKSEGEKLNETLNRWFGAEQPTSQ